jgi:hypothetical protein
VRGKESSRKNMNEKELKRTQTSELNDVSLLFYGWADKLQ